MKPTERIRLRFTFGMLAIVPVFLACWLAWVQVVQAGTLTTASGAPLRLVPATADRQARLVEAVPAPRGTIVDRHGSVLALDRETYEVRARVTLPGRLRSDAAGCSAWLRQLVDGLSLALVASDERLADRAAARKRHAERIDRALRQAFQADAWPASGALPPGQRRSADVLVAPEVDVLGVVASLRQLDELPEFKTVALHFLRAHRRDYPDRDLTHGLVGHVTTRWVESASGGEVLRTRGVCGLETFAVLDAEPAAVRRLRKDGVGRSYFVAPLTDPPVASVLHSTIDLELQRVAVRELASKAEAGAREGAVTIPKWGALVLVDIPTGDVLAAASWHRGEPNPEATAFTPYQSLFEPGSIVKPLVLAYAREVGALDWDHTFDCTPGGSEYRATIAPLGRRRPVRDDHDCTRLTPHGILTNSSNIGAAYVGLQLSREQWQDFMRFYGFGQSLGLRLPHESVGGTNRQSFAPGTPLRSFRANSAISFSIGYEVQVTALQMARAYLRLFRGAGAELRLCRGVELDGEWHEAPRAGGDGPGMRPEVVDAVRAAMTDVVSADPTATGHHLHANILKELGIDLHGLVAGKTGTAASNVLIQGRGTVEVRNASFVGLLPAHAPRWLAVCVLQKDDRARFYGSSYAAPPAVRLLLQCQQLEQRRQLRQESTGGAGGQARTDSGPPGHSGWSQGAPGTTSAGR